MLKNKKIFRYINLALLVAVLFGNVSVALAAEANSGKGYEVSGWIPYWRSVEGAKDAESHLNVLDVVHPFGYTVKTDGTLNDLAKISRTGGDSAAKTAWQNLFKQARKKDVEIIPTIMWSSGADIQRILSDKTLRKKHIKAIVDMVKKERVDGVNIDYEGKQAATKDHFSLFLKELKKELGKIKILSCAIEARTPPESLYRVVPPTISYANDLKEIGKHCDEVEVMAYDQGRADWQLNGEKAGGPYIPVADKDWVRKVAEYMSKDIPKKKMVLGVATYGEEYIVTVSPNRFADYKEVQSVNHPYAMMVSTAYSITPSRNKAGELSLSYLPHDGTAERNAFMAALPGLAVPAGTPSGEVIAQKALAYANTTGKTITFNILWWSDAEAIGDKVELVEELGLKGIAMFKIDAEADPVVWNILK
jgi:spore germination protein YaaH